MCVGVCVGTEEDRMEGEQREGGRGRRGGGAEGGSDSVCGCVCVCVCVCVYQRHRSQNCFPRSSPSPTSPLLYLPAPNLSHSISLLPSRYSFRASTLVEFGPPPPLPSPPPFSLKFARLPGPMAAAATPRCPHRKRRWYSRKARGHSRKVIQDQFDE